MKTHREENKNRKEQIIEAAISIFAEYGYYRATTAQVAEAVGISQPYVYKFFKTKEDLFLAAMERAVSRILRAFAEVDASAEQLPGKMGEAYCKLISSHRDEILLQVQAQASGEPVLREQMRKNMLRVHRTVLERFQQAQKRRA